jgi:hypothetical protein
MLEKIISDEQTATGLAALRAARVFGLQAGGWNSRESTDESPTDGARRAVRPTLTRPRRAPAWTEENVRDSDATLWLGETTTLSAQATVRACLRFGKPCLPIDPVAAFEPAHVAAWMIKNDVRTLNVAGNCEEEEPRIGDRVERFLSELLQHLGCARTDSFREDEPPKRSRLQ